MKNNAGFTLIEVLIALAILAIALTAIIKSTGQNIKDTTYLQNKTLAAWVGTEVVNRARANLIKLPIAPDALKDETEMLNQQWPWQASMEETPNPHIKKIVVDVFTSTNPDSIAHLESYLYQM